MQTLDWSDSSRHWSQTQRPCRYCQGMTNLRDSSRKAAHKVCAEGALQQRYEEAAASYENERLSLNDHQKGISS